MSEIASELTDSIHGLTDAFLTLAGVFAYGAATEKGRTPGEVREMAAVMFHTSRKRFGGVKYDGQMIDQATIDQLDAMWFSLFKIDPKSLPR